MGEVGETVVKKPCEHAICKASRADCFMDHDDQD